MHIQWSISFTIWYTLKCSEINLNSTCSMLHVNVLSKICLGKCYVSVYVKIKGLKKIKKTGKV